MSVLDKIHEYLLSLGVPDEDIDFYDSASVYLCQEIAMYAHRCQKRRNGASYFSHPYSVMEKYRTLVGIVEDDPYCINVDLLIQCQVPYTGVQEVCLLHDAIEDGGSSIDEIASVFYEKGLRTHFDAFIKEPLLLLTKKDGQSYEEYFENLLTNSTASIVKMMDLSDNLDASTLGVLNDEDVERLHKYVECVKKINYKWKFLENAQNYHMLRALKKQLKI